MRRTKLSKHTAKLFALMLSGAMIVSSAVPVNAAEKKEDKVETVYVNASATGETETVTVSEWLKSHGEQGNLDDYSTLKNIENVKGEETYTQNPDGSIVWNGTGDDIYYQGETDEELPVSVKVTYYLDGKKVSPDEIAGKSGKVTIRFDYYNHTDEKVKVNGKEMNVQTPFTMITAMIMPSDVFSNVKVENGKVITDGDKNIVVGLAFPGLKDSLQLDSYEQLSDISVPDYVEVTADAEEFNLALTASVATTGSLNDLNLDDIDDIDDLKADIDDLTDASTQLVDGTGELLDGMNTLSTSVNAYTKGVDQANQGAEALKDGLKTLNKNKDQLKGGADSLTQGLDELKQGTSKLASGIQSYTGGVDTLEKSISTASEGAGSLKKGSDALSKGLSDYIEGVDTVQSGLKQLNDTVANMKVPDEKKLGEVSTAAKALGDDAIALQSQAAAIQSLLEYVKQSQEQTSKYESTIQSKAADVQKAADNVNDKAEKQAESQAKEKAQAAVDNALSDAKASVKDALNGVEGLSEDDKNKIVNSIQGTSVGDIDIDIDAAEEAKSAANDLKKTATADVKSDNGVDMDKIAAETALTDMQKQAKIIQGFAASVSNLTAALPNLQTSIAKLNAGATSITSNDKKLLEGMKTLSAGVDSLSTGLAQMKTGAAQLTGNNETLNNGAQAADVGTGKLLTGSKTLVKGMKTFNAGIEKLAKGSIDLSKGTATLSSAGGQLTDGVDKLTDGAGTLNDGMKEFDEEGIQKIADLAGDDLETVTNHFKAVKKADKKYTSFAGIKEGDKGSVKFIIETAPVSAEE